MDYHIISFPGLGIDGIRINRLVFSVGNIQVAWYGLLITIGIALAVLYCVRRAKSVGIDSDTVIDIALLTVVLGVLGGLGLAGAAVASALFAREDVRAAAQRLLPLCRAL